MKWLDVLEFINKSEVVGATDLCNHFGYTEGGAYSTLGELKHRKLIVNDRRGEWVITDSGLSRLIYYGRVT
jgi:DNA-binding IclR family transcriptional regulator